MQDGGKSFFFVPDVVIAGRVKSGNAKADGCGSGSYPWFKDGDYAFLTCRFADGKLLQAGVFERLTGYRPTQQLDKAEQLRKTVTGAVFDVENAPTEGFRVAAWGRNPYGFKGGQAAMNSVVVLDPRGFCVGIENGMFFRSLGHSSGIGPGCRLAGKYVYAWDSRTKGMALIDASCAEYGEWLRSSKSGGKKPAGAKESGLAVGMVYSSINPNVASGDWMYVGRLDTYSYYCHVAAFDSGAYDEAGFAQREDGEWRHSRRFRRWGTSAGKMVFRRITPRVGEFDQPYVARSSVQGLFSPDPAAPEPGVLERVKAEIETHPAFQKLDLRTAGSAARASMPYDAFLLFAGVPVRGFDGFSNGYFPFPPGGGTPFMSESGEWLVLKHDWRDGRYTLYNQRGMAVPAGGSFREIYDAARPTYPVLAYENGRPVPPEFAAAFVPADVRRRMLGVSSLSF